MYLVVPCVCERESLIAQTSVESEIFGSGTILHSFMESVRTAKEKLVRVSIPRLTIQVASSLDDLK